MSSVSYNDKPRKRVQGAVQYRQHHGTSGRRVLIEVSRQDETQITFNERDQSLDRSTLTDSALQEEVAASPEDLPSTTLDSSVGTEGGAKQRRFGREGDFSSTKEVDSPSRSEEGGIDSSSGIVPTSSAGAAFVTADRTNSSGDDRASRTEAASSGGDDPVKTSPDSHRQVHHRHWPRERNSNSAGYGLPPVPRDDRVQTPSLPRHGKVVAFVPPPGSRDTSSSSSRGEGERGHGTSALRSVSLLQPHQEPGFDRIRRVLNQFVTRDTSEGLESDISGDQTHSHKRKSTKRMSVPVSLSARTRKRAYGKGAGGLKSDSNLDDDSGGSSGSGSDDGYIGSTSSNENGGHTGSASSPLSSSEDSVTKAKLRKGKPSSSGYPSRRMLSPNQESRESMSSDIADFSSGISESEVSSSDQESESEVSSSDQEDGGLYVNATNRETGAGMDRLRQTDSWSCLGLQVQSHATEKVHDRKHLQIEGTKPASHADQRDRLLEGKPPILSMGCDVIAHVLTFLEPPEILEVLTAPLCNDWLARYTRQPELWRVLCLVEPFKAQIEGEDDDESDESDPFDVHCQLKHTFGEFRLMYSSFVRCMRYLARIKDDAVNGRAPSAIEYACSASSTNSNVKANQNLQHFLSRARGLVVGNRTASVRSDSADAAGDGLAQDVASAQPVGLSDDGSSVSSGRKRRKNQQVDTGHQNKLRKVQYAASSLTQRLLGPSTAGAAGNVELPWSCAIYSIVNWMTAFSEVEGIQTICLKVLPFILENEHQRITAQRAGLTNIVLRAMVLFPNSCLLHTAAFHTIVLLARPLGGREGMLFHASAQNETGIFNSLGGHLDSRSGIAVMLDSMRRFRHDPDLQAMSCWSLVNIALVSSQKEMLVKLGGIQVAANAIMLHPRNAEVVYRAMFALINLVIPSVPVNVVGEGEVLGGVVAEEEVSEKDVLDEIVDQVVNLVVLSMKNFCASEAILNRACLVLHNLSLTQEYHRALLWTPDCYQMLEWCMINYRSDQVLQQSAAGTLHRMQLTLSGDDALHARFVASLQAQQQLSLERAHQEALRLLEHQRQATSQSQLPEPPQDEV